MFGEWNKTELDSFLIEITTDILKFKEADGKHLVDKIRDAAGQVRLKDIVLAFLCSSSSIITYNALSVVA